MSDSDDILLERFTATRDEPAFSQIVQRYINLVYSAALRQVRDRHTAEDVTQTVFIILAQKARTLPVRTILSAWLLLVTRYTAMNTLKLAARRRHHEKQAAEINTMNATKSDPLWADLEPHLDAALASLREADRQAIALRYFEDRPLRDVALALGISEDAAKQRVFRAIEKLRALLGAKGASVPAAALTAAIPACAIHAAPSALAATVTASALSASSATTLTVVKGVLKLMLYAKLKNSAIAAAVIFLLTTSAAVVYKTTLADPPSKTISIPITPGVAVSNPAPPADWQSRFDKVYSLAPGQVIKFVPMPFIPERDYALDKADPQRNMVTRNRGTCVFMYNGANAFWARWSLTAPSVSHVIRFVAGVPRYHFQLDDEIATRLMVGDFVISPDATPDQIMAALSDIIRQHGFEIRLEKQQVEREVFIATGSYKPRTDVPAEDRFVHVYLDQKQKALGSSVGNVTDLLRFVGEQMNREIIDETQTPKASVFWRTYLPGYISHKYADQLLDNITTETALNFHREKRPTILWTAVPQ
jgi:RNA polymerase sigma factor (sigma-70 family)